MNKPLFLRSNYLYVFGLLVLVTGLPLSLFLISISQFILAGAFFLEGNILEKWKRFLNHKPALLIACIWLMHVLGLIWTTNLAQGWNDIRIKLPLLILPIIIGGYEPLSKKQFHLVLGAFISAVFIGTMVSMAVLAGFIHREIVDIRDVFIFKISHIRFGLFTCIAIFSLMYLIRNRSTRELPILRVMMGLMVLWFFVFLFIVESITGLSISITLLLFFCIAFVWKRQTRTGKLILVVVAIALPLSGYLLLARDYEKNYSLRVVAIDMNAKTQQGNPYTFNIDNPEMENGYPAYIYMCDEELRRSWNRRSEIKFDSLDKRMQPIKYTLIRFLASKGLRKDSVAMMQLTDEEVHSIEKGIPNVDYQSPSVKVRLMQVFWEFDQYSRGGDPNGHSIMQRIESWKAACRVISAHLFFGVGTGDLPDEIHKQYALMHSKLDKEHYLRAHNQYLAIAVAFGITGLAFFLYALVYPLRFRNHRQNFLYMVFFLTLSLSMLTEDTLETQPGATFFAFFNMFFLYALPKGSTEEQ